MVDLGTVLFRFFFNTLIQYSCLFVNKNIFAHFVSIQQSLKLSSCPPKFDMELTIVYYNKSDL